jgi:hypothetical protein
MAFHNNGRKFYHAVLCNGKSHEYITDGMLFSVDEIKCKKHGVYASVVETNLTKNDAILKRIIKEGSNG